MSECKCGISAAIAACLDPSGKILSLPVQLGSELYEVSTNCGNFCYFQKDLFNRCFPVNVGGHCGRDKPCHTVEWNIYKICFSLSNIEMVLEDFGVWIFSSEEEARARQREVLKSHRETMRSLGFEMRADGVAIDKKSVDLCVKDDPFEALC